MKNILFIVTERNSANGICAQSVMNSLQECGYKVFCITNKEYNDSPNFILNDIEYFTISPRLSYKISSYLHAKSSYSFSDRLLKKIGAIINKIQMIFSYFYWPIISLNFTIRLSLFTKRIVSQNQIDAIIPIYTQIDSLIAAHYVKNKRENIKIIPYFLDAFAAGYGPKLFSRSWIINRGLKWERLLLKNVDRIIMMQSAKSFYVSRKDNIDYYSKIIFLDLPLFKPIDSSLSSSATNKSFNLLYIGSIPVHIRNPKFFLDVFMKTKNPLFKLKIVGTNTCPNLLKQAANKDKRIQLLGSVSHEEAMKLMNEADILVNLGNNSPMMTPSKIFEYMSLGKPIISTAPIDTEPSLRYLKYYSSAYILPENINLEKASCELEQFILTSKYKSIDLSELKNIFYLNTPTAFVKVINEICN